jgi:N6-L-threonylcarbamoyladenine synthase
MLADGLGVPLYHYSHQEGHIEAVRAGTRAQNMHRFVSFHLSGGTTEALLVDETPEETTYRIIGGTRDISYGQLLDRVAVALGMQFPGGEEMDQIALHAEPAGIRLPRIKVQDGYFHLSGLESHCQRFIASEEPVHKIRDGLILALFQEIARSMSVMMDQLYSIEHVEGFLFAGGVASSQFIRQSLASSEDVVFGDPALSGDNAVGIALLGGKEYGSETNQRLTTE